MLSNIALLLCLLLSIRPTEGVNQWNKVLKSSMSVKAVMASATAVLLTIPPMYMLLPSNAHAVGAMGSTVKMRLDSEKNEMPSTDLLLELENYEIDTESLSLRQKRQPFSIMSKLEKNFSAKKNDNRDMSAKSETPLEAEIEDAQQRVLTLAAYLDEIERDLFSKNWDNLQVYLYTFAEQENAFAILIDYIFPENTKLDENEREALSAEAKAMFLALDDLREGAKCKNFKAANVAYAKLLLSYDRFLKAGDMYPTYDPITSTEVFFKGNHPSPFLFLLTDAWFTVHVPKCDADTPKDTLRYDSKAKVQVLDEVLMTEGPDMGKTGMVINIDAGKEYAVVKLDKDGKAYNEVKYVKLKMLAKTLGK